jgi:hypothetical protein
MTASDVLNDPGFSGPKTPLLGRARGALSVFAGLVVIFAVTTATDVVLHTTGVFPPVGERMSDALFGLATAYRILYGVLGCYVAARLAPERPMRHALVLGGIGLLLGTMGAIAMWDCGPAWYSLAVIGIAMPCAWLGGRVRERQLG